MNLTGSVLPRIFGRSCICSRLTSVIFPEMALTEDVCLSVMNRVLSISINNESACARHYVSDDENDVSTSRSKDRILIFPDVFKTSCQASIIFYHSFEFLDEVSEVILIEIFVEQIS